jgi:hypothetical protein
MSSATLSYVPDGYGKDRSQNWPLLLFLHGVGERGSDLELVKINGPPKLIEAGKKFPFVVISAVSARNLVGAAGIGGVHRFDSATGTESTPNASTSLASAWVVSALGSLLSVIPSGMPLSFPSAAG